MDIFNRCLLYVVSELPGGITTNVTAQHFLQVVLKWVVLLKCKWAWDCSIECTSANRSARHRISKGWLAVESARALCLSCPVLQSLGGCRSVLRGLNQTANSLRACQTRLLAHMLFFMSWKEVLNGRVGQHGEPANL